MTGHLTVDCWRVPPDFIPVRQSSAANRRGLCCSGRLCRLMRWPATFQSGKVLPALLPLAVRCPFLRREGVSSLIPGKNSGLDCNCPRRWASCRTLWDANCGRSAGTPLWLSGLFLFSVNCGRGRPDHAAVRRAHAGGRPACGNKAAALCFCPGFLEMLSRRDRRRSGAGAEDSNWPQGVNVQTLIYGAAILADFRCLAGFRRGRSGGKPGCGSVQRLMMC